VGYLDGDGEMFSTMSEELDSQPSNSGPGLSILESLEQRNREKLPKCISGSVGPISTHMSGPIFQPNQYGGGIAMSGVYIPPVFQAPVPGSMPQYTSSEPPVPPPNEPMNSWDYKRRPRKPWLRPAINSITNAIERWFGGKKK